MLSVENAHAGACAASCRQGGAVDFRSLLQMMIDRQASDLHLKVGARPVLRIHGQLVKLEDAPVGAEEMQRLISKALTEEQRESLALAREIDFAFGVGGVGRFRANFYYQRGTPAIAVRYVPLGVPRIEQLNLPPVIRSIAMRPRGLVLVTGTVGSGKTTTLAAMIDEINRTASKNIITLEDPIEFLHRDQRALISQREVGLDTESYESGLKHILRQDPDVLLLGEIRTQQTMSVATMAANTGHLVLSTLHTIDAIQTVNRIISFYPPHQHEEVRFMLAAALQAVISMRLIRTADGRGRVPAVEVMVNTETIRDLLLDPGKTSRIRHAIAEGASHYGMQTFDQSLMDLCRRGMISGEEALRHASNPSEFELRMKGIRSASDATWEVFEQGTRAAREEESTEESPERGSPEAQSGAA
ncbi:MAG: PilT/PilU family type 4a pilus ATPase [Candidatus Eisenbacteria bacterium]|nr:PilT/PilU family type 4a pilus ATPase [Candidatus Eisenbacteria bacterium]